MRYYLRQNDRRSIPLTVTKAGTYRCTRPVFVSQSHYLRRIQRDLKDSHLVRTGVGMQSLEERDQG